MFVRILDFIQTNMNICFFFIFLHFGEFVICVVEINVILKLKICLKIYGVTEDLFRSKGSCAISNGHRVPKRRGQEMVVCEMENVRQELRAQ